MAIGLFAGIAVQNFLYVLIVIDITDIVHPNVSPEGIKPAVKKQTASTQPPLRANSTTAIVIANSEKEKDLDLSP
jgi:hypothetical protein